MTFPTSILAGLLLVLAVVLSENSYVQCFHSSRTQRHGICQQQRDLHGNNVCAPNQRAHARRTTQRNMRLKKEDERAPGSELFPGKGPYVPSGMSAQQYEELKKNEDDKMQKMNFGAWGPRFQPTDAPRGDWMVTPRLWTNGFHSDRSPASSPSSGAGASSSTSSSPSTKRTRIAEIIRDQGPGFALAYLLTAFLGSTHGLYRVAQQGWTLRAALLTVLRSAVFIPARISTWRTACAIICMRVAAATGLTQVGCRIIEQANRQRLWAPRRTIAVSAVTMFTSLLVWAGMLHLGMS